jgi:hypothetical protein
MCEQGEGKAPASLNSSPQYISFPWCSGYHICLTRRRSPVRSRTETQNIPRGLTARIPGFHPGGPGSTPGVGTIFIFQLSGILVR